MGRALTLDRPFEPHPEGGHFVAAVANRAIRAKLRTRRDPAEKNEGGPIGTALAAHVLATAVELNEKAACRAVVVIALHQRARTWWERLGFHPFDPDYPDRLDLYLLTSEIEATLKRAQ